MVAWVGKSVIFKGDLISSEDMTIDGRVEGTIELRRLDYDIAGAQKKILDAGLPPRLGMLSRTQRC